MLLYGCAMKILPCQSNECLFLMLTMVLCLFCSVVATAFWGHIASCQSIILIQIKGAINDTTVCSHRDMALSATKGCHKMSAMVDLEAQVNCTGIYLSL